MYIYERKRHNENEKEKETNHTLPQTLRAAQRHKCMYIYTYIYIYRHRYIYIYMSDPQSHRHSGQRLDISAVSPGSRTSLLVCFLQGVSMFIDLFQGDALGLKSSHRSQDFYLKTKTKMQHN